MNAHAKHLLAAHGPLLLVWGALFLLFGSLSENFLSRDTLGTLAGQVPPLAIIACGMTFVLLVAGIDLSVGSVMALCGAVLGYTLADRGLALPLAMLLAVAVGAAVGLFNGCLSVFLRIPSFIVTLGTLEVARGLSYLATGSETKYLGSRLDALIEPLPFLGVPPSFLVALAVVAAGHFVLVRSVYGRHLVAIGTNENAVRLAGIPVAWRKVGVFLLAGTLAGLASVFSTARLGSADPNAGVGFELSAIAAVVIGGTSLMGGRASVVNSFLGVLVIATLAAGLSQTGASEPTKRVVTGLVIVLAVTVDALRSGALERLRRRLQSRRIPKTTPE